jgi:hypothetical protein
MVMKAKVRKVNRDPNGGTLGQFKPQMEELIGTVIEVEPVNTEIYNYRMVHTVRGNRWWFKKEWLDFDYDKPKTRKFWW